jgi:hypothetical protein
MRKSGRMVDGESLANGNNMLQLGRINKFWSSVVQSVDSLKNDALFTFKYL